MKQRLVFVYSVNSSLFNQVGDLIRLRGIPETFSASAGFQPPTKYIEKFPKRKLVGASII